MNYIVMEIGCLECHNPSVLVGVFDTLDEAKATRDTSPWYRKLGNWTDEFWMGGDVMVAIFEVGTPEPILALDQ